MERAYILPHVEGDAIVVATSPCTQPCDKADIILREVLQNKRLSYQLLYILKNNNTSFKFLNQILFLFFFSLCLNLLNLLLRC